MSNNAAKNGLAVRLYKYKCLFLAISLNPNKIADNSSRPIVVSCFHESEVSAILSSRYYFNA